MIKYSLKTENTEKAAVLCSGEVLWGTHLPHVFYEGTGVRTRGINTEMEAVYCPNFLPQLMAPAGSAAGSHRKLLQNQAFIAQSLGKNQPGTYWSSLAMLRCTRT